MEYPLKCDACRSRAKYGAAIPREKRGPRDPDRGYMEARFVLCLHHARNLAIYPEIAIWLLPGEKEMTSVRR